MTTIAHPFRLAGDGAVATVDAASAQACAQLAGHVLACQQGERSLSPLFGLPDMTGYGEVPADVVQVTLGMCAPELLVGEIDVADSEDGTVTIAVSVDWADAQEDE